MIHCVEDFIVCISSMQSKFWHAIESNGNLILSCREGRPHGYATRRKDTGQATGVQPACPSGGKQQTGGAGVTRLRPAI